MFTCAIYFVLREEGIIKYTTSVYKRHVYTYILYKYIIATRTNRNNMAIEVIYILSFESYIMACGQLVLCRHHRADTLSWEFLNLRREQSPRISKPTCCVSIHFSKTPQYMELFLCKHNITEYNRTLSCTPISRRS